MKVSEYIVKKLQLQNIDTIFGYQGGNITYLIDAISNQDGIKYIQTYNEQGAAFAANAYAQTTNNFGVAIASSGPGAINLINGIANAFFDSIPCLFFVGGVNFQTKKESENVRQNAFQETDIISMVKGITKYATTVDNAQDIKEKLDKAISIMMTGRKGPVVLELPHNVQREEIDNLIFENSEIKTNNNVDISKAIKLIQGSNRPLFLIGGGCKDFETRKMINEIVSITQIPCVASLCGLNIVDSKYDFGLIGSYSLGKSNKVISLCDLIIILGSRLDERQEILKNINKEAKVIRVDIDENEINRKIKSNYQYCGDCKDFLKELLKNVCFLKKYDSWYKISCNVSDEYCYAMDKNTFNFISNINTDCYDTVCVDVGIHQMAVAQALKSNKLFLSSSGLGSMGYAIPASIGAWYGTKKKVLCFVGDGGLAMNLQELQVLNRDNSDILIVVINNKQLGMISLYQEKVFDKRLIGSKDGYQPIDIKKIANCFNLPYQRISNNSTSIKIKRGIVEYLAQSEE